MKNFVLFASYLLICATSSNCHKSDVVPSCSVNKPLEELAWLKEIVADTVATKNQNLNIYQTTYKDRITYRVDITPGPDVGKITLHDCQGSVLARGFTTIAGLQTENREVFNNTKIVTLLYSR